MKAIKKLFVLCIAALITLTAFTLTAFAQSSDEQSALHSLISTNVDTAKKENIISYGLNVVAYQNQMSIAGIRGNALTFSKDRFASAMNLSNIDSITVTKLPDGRYGTLYIGSEAIVVGQKISASSMALMTYEEASAGAGKNASFEFTVNGEAYPIVCNIFMISAVNYCPTVTTASYASLNKKTYRDVMIQGVLSAHDPEGDELTYEIIRYPSHGTVTVDDKALGTYTYVPHASYTGNDSFSYVVRDKYGNYSGGAKVSITVSAPSTSAVYSDILGDAIYTHAISMTESGLMNGVQVGNYFYFEADRQVSRAEFVMTAMNAIGIKNVPEVQTTGFFDDADIADEMKGYVALAYSKGYISGIKQDGNIYFRPNDPITLSEAAVIVSNMIGYKSPSVTPVFADADEIPSFASEAIESLYTLGILEFPDKTVGAQALMTRGDMAQMLDLTMQVISSMK